MREDGFGSVFSFFVCLKKILAATGVTANIYKMKVFLLNKE